MRPLWTGTIGFGLVNIPVKLFSATQASELDLDMRDKKDLSNIRFMRVNGKTGKEVEYKNIVKGYKLNDNYVVLEDKDLASANAVKTKLIEITDFVLEQEIDSIYYEVPYYLAPEKSGVRAYALLREALRKTGKVGVATFVMRNKENLAIIKVSGEALILTKMRFAEEIRDTKELVLPASTVKPAELKMAISLINQLSGKFTIGKYKDLYTAQLLKLIKAKAKGGKTTSRAPLKVVHSKAKDLMDQLKESLNTKRKKAS